MKSNLFKIYIIISFLFTFCSNFVFCSGISTSFSEVLLEDLQPGVKYSIEKIANFPLKVINNSSEKVSLKIEAIESSNLRPGFEKIPDLSWISLEKNEFSLNPYETAITDLLIQIPDKKKYLDKKYQVNIWSHVLSKNEGGVVFAPGLESVLLITTNKVKIKNTELVTEKVNLTFSVEPMKTFFYDIKVCKFYDLYEYKNESIKIINSDNIEHTYLLQSLPIKESMVKLEENYKECPNPNFLSFHRPEITVPAGQTGEIKLYLKFPDKKKYRNEKYMFVIYVSVKAKGIGGGIYTKVFVETK